MHEFEWKMVLVYIVNAGKSSKGTSLDHRTLGVRFSSFKYCQTKVGYALPQKIWHVNRNKRWKFLLMYFESFLCHFINDNNFQIFITNCFCFNIAMRILYYTKLIYIYVRITTGKNCSLLDNMIWYDIWNNPQGNHTLHFMFAISLPKM